MGEVKTCVIVTCLSKFAYKITFNEYQTDKGEKQIGAILTNEAGTQYLFRRILENNRDESRKVNVVLVLLESKEVKDYTYTSTSEKENKVENKSDLIRHCKDELDKHGKKQCLDEQFFTNYNEKLNEVIYFVKRMEYEWNELKPTNNFHLDNQVIHIHMDEENRYKCESEFMNHIKNLQRESAELEIYMDETGGPRDINYTFALLLRMLEYSNIKCKDIVYSNINNAPNKISSILAKHQYVDIVTGMDEFIKYGKIEMLRKQFETLGISQNHEGKNLLDAMQNYSEQLTLCNVDGFDKANDKLKGAINQFSENDGDNYVLNLLLKDLRKKIALDNDEERVPFLLRRCYDNDMIQQGITIYNELVPDYLIRTLQVLQIKRCYCKNNKEKIETLLHGMEIIACWTSYGEKNSNSGKKTKKFGRDTQEIVSKNYDDSIKLDWRNGYQKLFTKLIPGSKKKYGKYTSTYYVLNNLDLFKNQIKFPKGHKNKVIEVVKDYLEMRELRNTINHASDINKSRNRKEKKYRRYHFRLPVFKHKVLTYVNVKQSLRDAIKNLEELTNEQ